MQVIGTKKYDFESKEGDRITGLNIYLVEEGRDDVVGLYCEKISVSLKKLNGYMPKPKDDVRILYNRYGKVEALELL